MSQDHYIKVRQRFIVLVSAVLLVMLGLFWWQALRERELVIAAAGRSAASYAGALTEHAERVFIEVDSTLNDLVADIESHGGVAYTRSASFHQYLSERVRNELQFSSIYILDQTGGLAAHSAEFPVKPRNLAGRPYFKHHVDSTTSALYISAPYISSITNSTHFSLSRALRDRDGRFAGVVSLTVESVYFANFYRSIDVGGHGRILLTTSAGELLSLVPAPAAPLRNDLKGTQLFTSWLPASPTGVHQAVSPLSGDQRVVAYHRMNNFPVVAVVSYSRQDVLSPWRSNLQQQGLIAVLLTSLALFVSWLFLRQLQQIELSNRTLKSQQSELLFKSQLLETASDAVLLLDRDGGLLYFNGALAAMTGYSEEEIRQRGLPGIEPPEYAARIKANIDTLLQQREAIFESAYLRKSGAILPIEVHARVVELDGQLRVMSVVRDVSTHQELEYRLKAVATEWRDTFDAVDDAVWLLDMERHVLRANRATQKVFNLSPAEIVGQHCCQATYGTNNPRIDCPFEAMLKSGRRATVQLERGGRWYEVAVDPVYAPDGSIVRAVYIVKDIDDLKTAEQRERTRSRLLEQIAAGGNLPELLASIAVAVEKESPGALCSILQVSADGQRLVDPVGPSLPETYNRAVNRTPIGEGIGSCGTSAFRRERVIVEDIEGHPFWQGFTAAREAGLRSCWSEPIMSSAGDLQGTFAIYHRVPSAPDPGEIRLIQQAATFAGIAIERCRSRLERAELQQQLSQSQKMEAIGHLSGGIAHDFNNLLTPILIYADMLKRVLPDDPKVQSRVDGIIKASGKARDLTQQLLSFGRKQVMQMQALDLNDVVMSFHTMISRTLRETISLNLLLDPQATVVRADRSKLEQVLLNLTINAQDAIAVNGSITIETGHVLIDDEYARQHPGLTPGRSILLSCSDNGSGMSDETLRHIFEPFFSTKEVGHGTGLGLANVYGIVKQHNGYITASSAVGSGTTFKIYLPETDELPVSVQQEVVVTVADHAGTDTILVVEDNETVRSMTHELLQSFGYTVYSAEHPERALALLKSIPGRIDLLVTDVVMPGMNGQQLFQQIRQEHPEIAKVLYISGYTNNVIEKNGELQPGTHFLQKPFTVNALMTSINELLRAAR